MLSKIIVCEVRDKSDFNSLMARRAFVHQVTADGWGEVERDAARSRLRTSGETDEDYINAIVYNTYTMDFDPA